MKQTVFPRLALVVAMLAGFAQDSSAASLGRARGAVLVGRPLELSIGLSLDTQDDPTNLCLQADVLYGDTKVVDGKVRLTLDNARDPAGAQVRLSVSQVVDEPVVTVFLQAGCVQKVSRRFVVLSEMVVDTPASMLAVAPSQPAAPASLAASMVQPAEAAPPARVSASAAAASVPAKPVRPSASERRQAAREAAAQAAASAGEAAAPAPAAPKAAARSVSNLPKVTDGKLSPRLGAAGARLPERSGRSRLKLDPMDLAIERDPTLKASSDLLSIPATDEAQRSAAAALWRALSAQPQDVLRDAERLKTLERELKSARDAGAKSQARVTELSAQLEQAQSERYSNWLVYTLGGLLLLALAGGGAWFWRQRRQSGDNARDWWRALDRSEEAGFDPDLLDPEPKPRSRGWGRRKEAEKPSTPLDVDLDVDESLFEDIKRPVPRMQDSKPPVLDDGAPMDRPDFVASMPGIPRAVNAEELFDIQQQADFFVSLGQYDQAIEVLKTHISDNVETSALAYLDLFRIYHSLDRRAEFDDLREDFNKVFNAQVPSFDNFIQQSRGLEAYQTALSRIEALWPSPKVLDVIEESIFRKPGSAGEAFDLEAYRELLLLYAMAKDVVERGPDMMGFELPDSQSPVNLLDDEPAHATRFESTSIQPLSTDFGGRKGPASKLPAPEPVEPLEPLEPLEPVSAPAARASRVDEFKVDPTVELLPELDIPKASVNLGVDIDLGAFDEAPPALPSLSLPDEPDTGADSGPQALADEGPKGDPNLIDFDMFDSALEFEISKRPAKDE